jgi:hypothetical protein
MSPLQCSRLEWLGLEFHLALTWKCICEEAALTDLIYLLLLEALSVEQYSVI